MKWQAERKACDAPQDIVHFDPFGRLDSLALRFAGRPLLAAANRERLFGPSQAARVVRLPHVTFRQSFGIDLNFDDYGSEPASDSNALRETGQHLALGVEDSPGGRYFAYKVVVASYFDAVPNHFGFDVGTAAGMMKHEPLRYSCVAIAMCAQRLDTAGFLADNELQPFITKCDVFGKWDR